MSNYPKADYYSAEEKEFVTAESVEEAVQEWYDDWTEPEIPEFVEIYGYERKVISEASKLPDWWLEHIIESLEDNYGCEETLGDYSISQEAKLHWDAFVAQVIKEYPVSQLKEACKPFKVNVKKILGGDV